MSHLKGHVDKRMNYSETDYQILFKSLLQKKPKNALSSELRNREMIQFGYFYKKSLFQLLKSLFEKPFFGEKCNLLMF